MSDKKDLVDLIKANPGATFVVDNDYWTMHRENPYGPNSAPDEDDYEAFEAWENNNKLASDSDVTARGSGYGSGNCYGGDILQALAVIVGVKIESV
jgi:hypothetical protein